MKKLTNKIRGETLFKLYYPSGPRRGILYTSYGIINIKRNYLGSPEVGSAMGGYLNSLDNDKYKLIGLSEIENLKLPLF